MLSKEKYWRYKERIRKEARKYYQKNKERLKEYRRQYYKDNKNVPDNYRKKRREYNNIVAWTERQKEKIFEIKGDKCEKCGTTKELELHHLEYKKDIHVVMVLCKKCHVDLHFNMRK